MSSMLRALLVGLLAVSTLGGCGSKHDAPQVDPAAPAGKVIEVTNKVMVGTKALAVGDSMAEVGIIVAAGALRRFPAGPLEQ